MTRRGIAPRSEQGSGDTRSSRVRRSRWRLSPSIPVALAILTAALSGAPAVAAQAATTSVSAVSSTSLTTSIGTLASQIAALAAKTHDGGLAQQLTTPVLNILTGSGFDWNEVLFGTDALTVSQQQTATALTPDVIALVTEQDTTQAQALVLVNGIISAMQSVNPDVQATDVVAYLNAVVTDAPSEMLTLIGLPSLTPAIVAQNLHSAFAGYLTGVSPAIQGLFSANVNVSSAGGTTGSGTTGSGTTGSGTTGSGTTGSGTTGSSATGSGTLPNDLWLQETVSSHVGSWTVGVTGLGSLGLSVPPNALPVGSVLTVGTYVPPGKLVFPGGARTLASFRLHLKWAAAKPLTLTLTGREITRGILVYTLTPQGMVPFAGATVVPGRVMLTSRASGTFFLLTPTPPGLAVFPHNLPVMTSGQRAIALDGEVREVCPGVVVHGTTYLPISSVIRLLQSLGVRSTWKVGVWTVDPPTTMAVSLSNLTPGRGQYAMAIGSQLVLRLPAMIVFDRATQAYATYMPIARVMQVLVRLGMVSAWDGKVWAIEFGQ